MAPHNTDIPIGSQFSEDISPTSSGTDTLSSVSDSDTVPSSVARILQQSISNSSSSSSEASPAVISLQNFHQTLVEAAKTQNLSAVEEISLHIQNKDASLQRLSYFLPNLRQISLYGSVIQSIREVGSSFEKLTKLNVGRCRLITLDGILGLPNLEELYAEYNKIEEVGPCAFATKLRIIDLNSNRISDIQSIGFLTLCTNLRDLHLDGCPVSTVTDYRKIVKYLLPQIISLDGRNFEPSGRWPGSVKSTEEISADTETIYKNISSFPELETPKYSNRIEIGTKITNPLTPSPSCSSDNTDDFLLLEKKQESLTRNIVKLPPIKNARTFPIQFDRPSTTNNIVTLTPADRLNNRPATSRAFNKNDFIADFETIKRELKNLPAIYNPFSEEFDDDDRTDEFKETAEMPEPSMDIEDPETLIKLSHAWRVSSASRRNKNINFSLEI